MWSPYLCVPHTHVGNWKLMPHLPYLIVSPIAATLFARAASPIGSTQHSCITARVVLGRHPLTRAPLVGSLFAHLPCRTVLSNVSFGSLRSHVASHARGDHRHHHLQCNHRVDAAGYAEITIPVHLTASLG